jgi:hypothetical protein
MKNAVDKRRFTFKRFASQRKEAAKTQSLKLPQQRCAS